MRYIQVIAVATFLLFAQNTMAQGNTNEPLYTLMFDFFDSSLGIDPVANFSDVEVSIDSVSHQGDMTFFRGHLADSENSTIEIRQCSCWSLNHFDIRLSIPVFDTEYNIARVGTDEYTMTALVADGQITGVYIVALIRGPELVALGKGSFEVTVL